MRYEHSDMDFFQRELLLSATTNPEEILNIMVEYTGDIEGEFRRIDYGRVIVINPFNAIILVRAERLSDLLRDIKSIQFLDPIVPFTLTQVSPIEAANIIQFSQGGVFDLRGSGVIVGIIDTGIDYLNREFTTEDGRTRIDRIWDQTIDTGTAPFNIGFGSEYTREDINRALEAQRGGEDPYAIVPQRDEIGHGTANAGIIGARGYEDVVGAAPDCEFVVVKLREVVSPFLEAVGIFDEPGIYRSADIVVAVYYLTQVQKMSLKPMVIFIPLGSNFGGHDGSSPLERIIDSYVLQRGLVFVTGTGNQGGSETHAGGFLTRTGDSQVIEINVDETQRGMALNIWCSYPDRMSVSITSPTGEIIQRVPARPRPGYSSTFLYEKTTVDINYSFPENITGDELILIVFKNLKPGIWIVTLYGDRIVNGKYDIWLPQRPLSKPNTRFLNPNNIMTLTIPSTSRRVIATSYYDQSNNVFAPSSGVGFTRDNRIKPDLASGGVDVLTTAVGGGTISVTGSSAATAVLAGAVALILQWGIVNGNDPKLYVEEIRSYLIRGTRKRPGDVYPNQEWGYGILDLAGAFDAIAGQESNIATPTRRINRDITYDKIYTVIPREVYHRLSFDNK
jgi:subtilisin family serine protease